MIEKHADGLIIFAILMIIALGSIYYAKSTGKIHYSTSNYITYDERTYENISETMQNNYSEDRQMIGNVEVLTNTDTSQNGYKFNNRYYYNELTDCSKAIYDAIVDNLDKIQKGTCTIQINYDFNSLLNEANGEKILKDYYNDVINALNLDIPNLFYLDFQKLVINIEKTTTIFSTTYKVFINSREYPNFYPDEFASFEEVNEAMNQMEKLKKDVTSKALGSEYYKIRYAHDWLIDYMYYDNSSPQSATVYGGLIEKKGVCEAYSRIYKYILDEMGIKNILVTGTATNSTGDTENHMWNYIKLNENWYAVDVTWDDPVVIGGGTLSEEYKHRYFLVRKWRIF